MGFLAIATNTLKPPENYSTADSFSGRMLEVTIFKRNKAFKAAETGHFSPPSFFYGETVVAAVVAIVENIVWSFFAVVTFVCDRGYNSKRHIYAILRSSIFSFFWALHIIRCIARPEHISDREPLMRLESSRAFPKLLGWCFQPQDQQSLDFLEKIAAEHSRAKAYNEKIIAHNEKVTTVLSKVDPTNSLREFTLNGVKKTIDLKAKVTNLLTRILATHEKNETVLGSYQNRKHEVLSWVMMQVVHAFTMEEEKYVAVADLKQETCNAISRIRLDKEFQTRIKNINSDPRLSKSLKDFLSLPPVEFSETSLHSLPSEIRFVISEFKSIAALELQENAFLTEHVSQISQNIVKIAELRECLRNPTSESELQTLIKKINSDPQLSKNLQNMLSLPPEKFSETHLDLLPHEIQCIMSEFKSVSEQESQQRIKTLKDLSFPLTTCYIDKNRNQIRLWSTPGSKLMATVCHPDGLISCIGSTKIRNGLNPNEDPITFHNRLLVTPYYRQWDFIIKKNGILEIWPRLRT